MPVTIKQLVDDAARKIGILAGGGAQMTSDEYADALGALRMMLDAWSLEDLMIPFHPTESFALSSDRNMYSMGDLGDWDTIRPEQVLTIRIQTVDGLRYPLTEASPFVLDEVSRLTVGRPQRYMVNRDARFVLIEFDRYPETGSRALVTTLKPFNATALENFDTAYDPDAEPESFPASGFTLQGIQTPLDFPSGYLQCIVYNLAVHMAPEYGRAAPDTVLGLAANAKRLVKRRNWRPMYLKTPEGLRQRPRVGTYDIYGGPY